MKGNQTKSGTNLGIYMKIVHPAEFPFECNCWSKGLVRNVRLVNNGSCQKSVEYNINQTLEPIQEFLSELSPLIFPQTRGIAQVFASQLDKISAPYTRFFCIHILFNFFHDFLRHTLYFCITFLRH